MELEKGYEVEIDKVGKGPWDLLLQGFDDANIYQAWAYESVISGEKKVSHLMLRRGGETVGMAQVRILKVPLTRVGVAHLRWGPLWKLHGRAPEPEVFRQILRALRNEYACKRRLVIRLIPLLFNDDSETFDPILIQEGFARQQVEEAQRTLLMDLGRNLEELRKGLDRKWRNRLNQTERRGLHVVEGYEDVLFAEFINIFDEMHARKRFVKGSDVNQFRTMQRDLPDPLKMKVSIAYCDGRAAAGQVCSRIGDTGVNLFAATSNSGLQSKASYLLQWRTIGWLRENGVRWYNLHGINPVTNPGTYEFKSGLCGKNGRDLCYMGTYASHESSLASRVIGMANFTRVQYRKSRMLVNGRLLTGRRKRSMTGGS